MNRRNLLAAALAGPAMTAAAPSAAAPATGPARPHVVAADGARLFLRDWGAGRPVVFLAGWTLSSDMWAYQMAPLSEAGFRCIAYDRRGHGKSDDPGHGYDYDTLADDLAAVLDALDLRDVVLVAHSMAGGEAVRYLSRHGKSGRVARVLFLAPTLPCLARKADNPNGVPMEMLEMGRKAFLADFPGWLDANTDPFVVPETSQGIRTWIKAMMMQASMKAIVDCNRAMITADFRDEMAAIDLPCLVIHGDRDASAPLAITGQPAAGLLKNGRLKVYPGAPHGLFATHIAPLNADLAAFARA
ncbi:alpha/beta fold hydrolase [Phenylobacterium sp.]|uniref:alpha/beta fold hydrolase n=1 Tax=Phenylobacterium sp. TaxID=1871053 RepID=UPI0035B3359A